MNTQQLLAKYVCGYLWPGKLPNFALTAIDEGFDSPSLWILSGLSQTEDSNLIERYFELSLKELGLQLPLKRQAALTYAVAIADEIIAGRQELIRGIAEIKYGAIDSFDFHSETKQLLFDSIGFNIVNGLFYEYEDLTDINPSLKRDLEAIDNIKIELYLELVKWRENTGISLS